MKTWECTECGREIGSFKKPSVTCTCGARGKWVLVLRMAALLLLFALSACKSATDQAEVDAAPAVTVSVSLPTLVPTDTPQADPAPSASPIVSPLPSSLPSSLPSTTPSPVASPIAPSYSFGGGTGTQLNPYRLDTSADVQHLCDFPSAFYKVTQDINMSTVSVVGSLCDFSGSIDGQFYELYNLYVISVNSQPAGLFGLMSGMIKNLTLNGSYIVQGNFIVSTGAFAITLSGSVLNSKILGTFINQLPTYPIATIKTQIAVLNFAPSGPRSLVGTQYDITYNGIHYVGSY